MTKLISRAQAGFSATGGYKATHVEALAAYLHKHPMTRCLMTHEEVAACREILGADRFAKF